MEVLKSLNISVNWKSFSLLLPLVHPHPLHFDMRVQKTSSVTDLLIHLVVDVNIKNVANISLWFLCWQESITLCSTIMTVYSGRLPTAVGDIENVKQNV